MIFYDFIYYGGEPTTLALAKIVFITKSVKFIVSGKKYNEC